MTEDLTPRTIDPMQSPQKTASDHLPGTDVIGCSLNVTGEYCSNTSLKRQVIDLGELNKDCGNGRRTSELVTLKSGGEGMATEQSGSSLRTVATNFSLDVTADGKYSYFSGEISASYDTSTSSRVSTQYVQYTEQQYLQTLMLPDILDLRKHILPSVQHALESSELKPEELFEYYGTHFLSSLIVGARVSYSCAIDQSEYSSKQSLTAAAKASYRGLTGQANIDASTEIGKAATALNEKALRRARVLGGDPNQVGNILNGDYNAWRASIADNQHVVDIKGGMHRISGLISDEGRKKAVDDAITRILENEKWPDSPYLVRVQPYLSSDKLRWYFSAKNEVPPTHFGPYPKEEATFYAYSEPREGSKPIYRFHAGSPDKLRFMLSLNPKNRNGWTAEPEPAFYAYVGGGNGRTLIHSHFNTAQSDSSGWFYSKNAKVSGWTPDPSNNFYVPAV